MAASRRPQLAAGRVRPTAGRQCAPQIEDLQAALALFAAVRDATQPPGVSLYYIYSEILSPLVTRFPPLPLVNRVGAHPLYAVLCRLLSDFRLNRGGGAGGARWRALSGSARAFCSAHAPNDHAG